MAHVSQGSRVRNRALKRVCVVALAIAAVLQCLAPSAGAGATDPVLAIHAATVQAGARSVVVVVDGAFRGADLVQISYPLQVLVRVLGGAGHYLRYDLVAGPFAGEDASIGAELSAAEAASLLLAGTPEPDARVIRMDPGRLVLALPPRFPSGDAEVQLFVADGGTVLLSNAWPLEVVEIVP